MSEHKKLSLSVVLGTLLIPLTAFAASVMVGDGRAAEVETLTSEVPTVHAVPDGVNGDDLEIACGAAGLELVAAETDGSITDVQLAALSALRGICTQQGMALPGPVSDTGLQTVALRDPGSTLTISQGSLDDDDDDHDDDHEEDDDDHDSHDNDHEEEDDD